MIGFTWRQLVGVLLTAVAVLLIFGWAWAMQPGTMGPMPLG